MSKVLLTDKQKEHLAAWMTELIDRCTSDWVRPWAFVPEMGIPCTNVISKKPLGIFNDFVLSSYCAKNRWKMPYFITLNMAIKNGLVRMMPKERNEEHEPILLRPYRKEDKDREVEIDKETGSVMERCVPVVERYEEYFRVTEDGTYEYLSRRDWLKLSEEEQKKWRMTRRKTGVWELNVEQTLLPDLYPEAWQKMCDDFEKRKNELPPIPHEDDVVHENLEKVINEPGGWRCTIAQDGGSRAYYIPGSDEIHLPKVETFYKRSKFYSTALHEMAHSTAPAVNRKHEFTGFGSQSYAREELVAEMTAMIVARHFNIEVTNDPNNPYDQEHLAYLKGWRKACKNPEEVVADVLGDVFDAVRYEVNYINYVDDRIAKFKEKAAKAA